MENFLAEMGTSLTDPNEPNISGNLVSMLAIGGLVGALAAAAIADKLGRKMTVIIMGLIFDLGTGLQMIANYGSFLTGRIISGFAAGALSMVVPLYISEMAPKHIRGSLVSFYGFFIYFGGLVSYWILYADVNRISQTSSEDWRMPIGLQFIFGTVMVLLVLLLPDTVRWLARKGKIDEARKSLAYIRQMDITDPRIREEFDEIQISIEQELVETDGARFKEILLPANRYRVLTTVPILLWQELTGHLAFGYYAPVIFKSMGFKGQSSGILATGVYGVVNCVATMIYLIFFIERYGRRIMFIQGALGMAITILIAGILLRFYPPNADSTTVTGPAIAMAVLIYLFSAFFSCSWGPTAWVYVSEVYPNRIRDYCVSLSVAMNWVGNIAVGKFVPIGIATIGWKLLIVFFVLNMFFFFYAIAFIKETKGLSLEEIDSVFQPTDKRDVEMQPENNKPETVEIEQAN